MPFPPLASGIGKHSFGQARSVSPWLLAGVMFLVFGLVNEAVVGDIRHLFDRQYLSKRIRRGGYSTQRLLYGRGFLVVGTVCLLVAALSSLG